MSDIENLVWVCRQPGDHRRAKYRIEDLMDVDRDNMTGGVQRVLPRSVLCAYVWCDQMVDGEVAHSCRHGPPPHRIKVVIPKAGNDPKLWVKLAGEEYREPRPLDMSPEAIEKRRMRAAAAIAAKAAKRAALIDTTITRIAETWPVGRLPSGSMIAAAFGVPGTVAKLARSQVVAERAKRSAATSATNS